MVRFIISISNSAKWKWTRIYIPIWLDLLYADGRFNEIIKNNLHSNMVRFIILHQASQNLKLNLFTFQYG